MRQHRNYHTPTGHRAAKNLATQLAWIKSEMGLTQQQWNKFLTLAGSFYAVPATEAAIGAYASNRLAGLLQWFALVVRNNDQLSRLSDRETQIQIRDWALGDRLPNLLHMDIAAVIAGARRYHDMIEATGAHIENMQSLFPVVARLSPKFNVVGDPGKQYTNEVVRIAKSLGHCYDKLDTLAQYRSDGHLYWVVEGTRPRLGIHITSSGECDQIKGMRDVCPVPAYQELAFMALKALNYRGNIETNAETAILLPLFQQRELTIKNNLNLSSGWTEHMRKMRHIPPGGLPQEDYYSRPATKRQGEIIDQFIEWSNDPLTVLVSNLRRDLFTPAEIAEFEGIAMNFVRKPE